MAALQIIWNRKQKIPFVWFLVLLLNFGNPQPSRAGSASDTFSNSLDSPSEDSPNFLSPLEDYFRDWFKRVGYLNHSETAVRLYFQETFTFLMLDPPRFQ